MTELLTIEELSIAFDSERGRQHAVRRASLAIGRGEFVGLVGESGSGKSLTALASMRLLPPAARMVGGRIRLEETEVTALSEAELQAIRGARIGLVFQEPMSALNPVLSIGTQVVEALRVHRPLDRQRARKEAARLLERVALSGVDRLLKRYPHQLSGGQRQRVVIALALAGEPDLLIADEPTTALDVTVQAQILDLLSELRRDLGLAVLLITHDLAVIAETCDRVYVMYAGEIVEQAPTVELFAGPLHPYSRALLAALPRIDVEATVDGRLPTIPGQIPEAGALPGGCAFHPRCDAVMERCRLEEPPLYAVDKRHSRCFLSEQAETVVAANGEG